MATGNIATTNSAVPIAFAVGAVVATTIAWQFSRSKTKPLHVKYQKPAFPWIIHVMAAFPSSMLRSTLVQTAAPKPPLDSFLLGLESSPYVEKKELVPGQLWRVRYQFVRDIKMLGIFKAMFGMDLLDMKAQLARLPPDDTEAREQLKQHILDFEALKKSLDDNKDDSPETKAKKLLEAGCYERQDMLVVRLNNHDMSCGLLLYNPCRMHPEMIDYLKSLGHGDVHYIVSGSSSHTNQLPQAAKAFPDAKIICAAVANEKCQAAGMRPADYIYTDHRYHTHDNDDGFKAAALELAQLGVQMIHVQGDDFTQSLVLVAHGHLLETDLCCYGNGHRYLHIAEPVWNDTHDRSLATGYFRLLYHASIGKGTVAKGYLPDFRVMGCDPTSVFHKLTLEGPAPDGSSCVAMARFLRKLLTEVEFDFVDNVHSSLDESLSAEEFKQAMNGCWSWLDGKSLLEA